MLTDRDIVCRFVADNLDRDHTKVRDIMTKGCAWCSEDQSLLDAAEVMRDCRIRHLPILNHEQKVVGIISIDDLCEAIPDAIFAATRGRGLAGDAHAAWLSRNADGGSRPCGPPVEGRHRSVLGR